MSRNGTREVRPEIASIPLIILATLAFRAESLTVGVGGDEYSLLAMAAVVAEGGFPYAVFWDVRPPLAYFWGTPSAYFEDAVGAIATLRLLALLAQGVAAWLFFCVFHRQFGSLPAALGAATLLASANIAELHQIALPNHFVMALSMGAFACAVEGIRRNLRPMYFVSAVLAGLLPWMMVHAVMVALAITVVAACGAWSRGRWAGPWLAVAALPSVAVVGAYALWGPFDALVRTVLLAPVDFAAERFGRGASFLPGVDTLKIGLSLTMAQYGLLLLLGIACLPRLVAKAASGSALRLSPWLVLPPMLPVVLMASLKGGAPEYWIDAAPTAALLAAAATYRLFSMPAWAALAGFRLLPSVLRGCVALYLLAVLAAMTRPEQDAVDPVLPTAYCDAAFWWMERLEPGRTVLDTSALCGYSMLKSGASLHPPFTFTDHWFRQLDMGWVGRALAGDGSETAAVERLRLAIGSSSSAGIILADGRFCDEVRHREWQASFSRDWIQVWFRHIEGYDAEDRLSALAVFVRRDIFLDARDEWLEEAWIEGRGAAD